MLVARSGNLGFQVGPVKGVSAFFHSPSGRSVEAVFYYDPGHSHLPDRSYAAAKPLRVVGACTIRMPVCFPRFCEFAPATLHGLSADGMISR